MEVLICLAAGLALINLLGYYQGFYRERFVVRNLPIDRIIGTFFFVVFFIVYKYAPPAYSLFPLVICSAGLGAFYHTMGAGRGAKARQPELPVLVLPLNTQAENKERS